MGPTNLTNFFDQIYCVNLDRRPDRWEAFQERIPDDWPFGPIYHVQALDGQRIPRPKWWSAGPGAWGCYRTHLRLMEDAINNQYQRILIFEDDAVFHSDFAKGVTCFISSLPEKWSIAYLGGQHLKARLHPPIKVNDHVFRPYNVNRTHAYALQLPGLKKVYQHLCGKDWNTGHHIDHHLGRYHQVAKDVYCPAEWLVGQAAGKSNISGKDRKEYFWMPAKKTTVNVNEHPFIAVVGLHSSGSSAIAGLLHHLGVNMGDVLKGRYGDNPDGDCGFEAVGLMGICETILPFPDTKFKIPRGKAWKKLRHWINFRRRIGHKQQVVVGGKYPTLCVLGDHLMSICKDQLYVVNCVRPLEESVVSVVQRTGNKKAMQHQEWLHEEKRKFINKMDQRKVITIDYPRLLANPQRSVKKLVQFLERIGVEPSAKQIKRAIQSIDPSKRTVGVEQ